MSIFRAIKALFSKQNRAVNENAEAKSVATTNTSQAISKLGESFQFQDGRRYQNEQDVSYLLPNDYDELDRIHQQHWMLKFILQRNFHSPVENKLIEGINVLDAGCGPGTWTLEMADTYPRSKFIGLDTSAVFPENIKPKNVDFLIANISKTLPFPDNHFDYIHQRFLILGLTGDDWNSCLNEMYRVLKPGGYIELVEPDYDKAIKIGPLLNQLQEMVKKMLSSKGLIPGIAFELKDRAAKAGFNLKYEKKIALNMNHTDKGGELFWDDFKEGYTGLRPILALFNKEWEDPEKFKEYLNQVAIECRDNQTYAEMYVYCLEK